MPYIKLPSVKYRKILILVIEVFFFSFVNPYTSPTIILVMAIGFIVYDYYLIIDYLISKLISLKKSLADQKNRIVFALSISGGLFIMLESLGQLTLKDSIVIILLILIGYLYTWYINTKTV